MNEEQIVEAYNAGWADAVRLYAVWKNGEQLVGVMERPLGAVLSDGPPFDIRVTTLAPMIDQSIRNDISRCQSCQLDDHARCTGQTTLGTMLCQCDCSKERRKRAES